MPPRLTTRGKAVVVVAAAAVSLGFGVITAPLCYWGICDAPPTGSAYAAARDVIPAGAFETREPERRFAAILVDDTAAKAPACTDPLALALADAGWTGPENRVAWAIVMRESRGVASKVSGPNGQDRGLWQLNRPAWSGEPWWDEQALLDETYNIHAARLLWEEYGARPWGLTADGDLDSTDYQRWTPEQQDRWIMQPWREWFDAYPCKVAPAAVRGES